MPEEPNATLRAIRIFSSESQWGEEARWAPPGQPFEAAEFPRPNSAGRIFLGSVPEEIRKQLQARDAFRTALMKRLVGSDESLDDAVRSALQEEPVPAYDDADWYITFVFDCNVHLIEDGSSESSHVWWDVNSTTKRFEKFREDAEEVLDVLTAHASMVIEPTFFDSLETESDIAMIIGNNRPLSLVPRFSGSAKASVKKSGTGFPADELAGRLEALTAGAWQDHEWLRRAIGWYVGALTSHDRWSGFQSSWFVLELLTNKLAPRYRDNVLKRLAYPGLDSAAAALAELVWAEDRNQMPLVAKFALVALEFDPSQADEDLGQFKIVKKARDELAHGLISQFDDLPVAKLRDLVRKYLDLALQRLLP